MKKLFSLLLVVMLLCTAMTGCFTSINPNPTEPEEPTGDTEKTTSVKITDTFSAEDPEGVTYAILLMNALVWIIDRHTAPRRFGVKKGGKA